MSGISPASDGHRSEVLYVGHLHSRSSGKVGTVQFRHNVIVEEVRILPLDFVPLQNCDIWESFRGRTSPDHFNFECFINNISEKGQGKFLRFGSLLYTGKDVANVRRDQKGPRCESDHLVTCGSYTTVTICVLGRILREKPVADKAEDQSIQHRLQVVKRDMVTTAPVDSSILKAIETIRSRARELAADDGDIPSHLGEDKGLNRSETLSQSRNSIKLFEGDSDDLIRKNRRRTTREASDSSRSSVRQQTHSNRGNQADFTTVSSTIVPRKDNVDEAGYRPDRILRDGHTPELPRARSDHQESRPRTDPGTSRERYSPRKKDAKRIAEPSSTKEASSVRSLHHSEYNKRKRHSEAVRDHDRTSSDHTTHHQRHAVERTRVHAGVSTSSRTSSDSLPTQKSLSSHTHKRHRRSASPLALCVPETRSCDSSTRARSVGATQESLRARTRTPGVEGDTEPLMANDVHVERGRARVGVATVQNSGLPVDPGVATASGTGNLSRCDSRNPRHFTVGEVCGGAEALHHDVIAAYLADIASSKDGASVEECHGHAKCSRWHRSQHMVVRDTPSTTLPTPKAILKHFMAIIHFMMASGFELCDGVSENFACDSITRYQALENCLERILPHLEHGLGPLIWSGTFLQLPADDHSRATKDALRQAFSLGTQQRALHDLEQRLGTSLSVEDIVQTTRWCLLAWTEKALQLHQELLDHPDTLHVRVVDLGARVAQAIWQASTQSGAAGSMNQNGNLGDELIQMGGVEHIILLLECPALGTAAKHIVQAFDSAMSMAPSGFKAVVDAFVGECPAHLAVSTMWAKDPPAGALMEVLQREHSTDTRLQHAIGVVYAKMQLCSVLRLFQSCVEEACLSPTGIPRVPSTANVEAIVVALKTLRKHLLGAHSLVLDGPPEASDGMDWNGSALLHLPLFVLNAVVHYRMVESLCVLLTTEFDAPTSDPAMTMCSVPRTLFSAAFDIFVYLLRSKGGTLLLTEKQPNVHLLEQALLDSVPRDTPMSKQRAHYHMASLQTVVDSTTQQYDQGSSHKNDDVVSATSTMLLHAAGVHVRTPLNLVTLLRTHREALQIIHRLHRVDVTPRSATQRKELQEALQAVSIIARTHVGKSAFTWVVLLFDAVSLFVDALDKSIRLDTPPSVSAGTGETAITTGSGPEIQLYILRAMLLIVQDDHSSDPLIKNADRLDRITNLLAHTTKEIRVTCKQIAAVTAPCVIVQQKLQGGDTPERLGGTQVGRLSELAEHIIRIASDIHHSEGMGHKLPTLAVSLRLMHHILERYSGNPRMARQSYRSIPTGLSIVASVRCLVRMLHPDAAHVVRDLPVVLSAALPAVHVALMLLPATAEDPGCIFGDANALYACCWEMVVRLVRLCDVNVEASDYFTAIPQRQSSDAGILPYALRMRTLILLRKLYEVFRASVSPHPLLRSARDASAHMAMHGAPALRIVCQACVAPSHSTVAVHLLVASLQPVLMHSASDTTSDTRTAQFWEDVERPGADLTPILPRVTHTIADLVFQRASVRHAAAATRETSDSSGTVAVDCTEERVQALLAAVGRYATVQLLEALGTGYVEYVSKKTDLIGDEAGGDVQPFHHVATLQVFWALLLLGSHAHEVERGPDVFRCLTRALCGEQGAARSSVLGMLVRPSAVDVLDRARLRFLCHYVKRMQESEPTRDDIKALSTVQDAVTTVLTTKVQHSADTSALALYVLSKVLDMDHGTSTSPGIALSTMVEICKKRNYWYGSDEAIDMSQVLLLRLLLCVLQRRSRWPTREAGFMSFCDYASQVCLSVVSISRLFNAVGIRTQANQLHGCFQSVLSTPHKTSLRASLDTIAASVIRLATAAMEHHMGGESNVDAVIITRSECAALSRDLANPKQVPSAAVRQAPSTEVTHDSVVREPDRRDGEAPASSVSMQSAFGNTRSVSVTQSPIANTSSTWEAMDVLDEDEECSSPQPADIHVFTAAALEEADQPRVEIYDERHATPHDQAVTVLELDSHEHRKRNILDRLSSTSERVLETVTVTGSRTIPIHKRLSRAVDTVVVEKRHQTVEYADEELLQGDDTSSHSNKNNVVNFRTGHSEREPRRDRGVLLLGARGRGKVRHSRGSRPGGRVGNSVWMK
eukprot:m.1417754 g.1417754  ORF g.1417754 m.1417754 type:complete len:2116 (+) comp25036_c0_seq1:92-6439(+)